MSAKVPFEQVLTKLQCCCMVRLLRVPKDRRCLSGSDHSHKSGVGRQLPISNVIALPRESIGAR